MLLPDAVLTIQPPGRLVSVAPEGDPGDQAYLVRAGAGPLSLNGKVPTPC